MFNLAVQDWTILHRNIPDSDGILFFTALNLTFPRDTCTTEHHFCFDPAVSFFLELLVIALCYSPIVYWTPSNLVGSSSSVIFFAFPYSPWSSLGKNTWVGCHFLFQWTTFCQNSSVWFICLGWSYTAWLLASLRKITPSPWQSCDPWRGTNYLKLFQKKGI